MRFESGICLSLAIMAGFADAQTTVIRQERLGPYAVSELSVVEAKTRSVPNTDSNGCVTPRIRWISSACGYPPNQREHVQRYMDTTVYLDIRRIDGAAFTMSSQKAFRHLRRFCRIEDKKPSTRPAGVSRNSAPQPFYRFKGRCKPF